MGFVEKIKRIATGKSEMERKQESAAMSEIRRKALAAQLKEREAQAVKFAQERERVSYEKRTKALRTPKPGFFQGMQGYGSPFGQPRFQQSRAIKPTKKYKTVYVKKGKHYVKKKVRAGTKQPRINQPQKFIDVIGMGRRSNILGI